MTPLQLAAFAVRVSAAAAVCAVLAVPVAIEAAVRLGRHRRASTARLMQEAGL